MYEARNSKTGKNCKILFEYKNGTEVIVFDTETTGKYHDKDDRIVEIALQKYVINEKHLKLVEEKDIYIKPPFWMSQKVIDIHHITNEFLSDKPSEEEVIDEIADFFGERPIIAGHNIPFDIAFVSDMYERCGKHFNYIKAFDTLEMARDLVTPKEVEDYRLGTLASYYGAVPKEGDKFHNALFDTTMTASLLQTFYYEYSKLPEINSSMLETAYINSAHFWEGRNKDQKGIWVETNLGRLYFSTTLKRWRSSQIDLSRINIDLLEQKVLERLSLSYDDMCRITKKKWEEHLSQRRRA